jgi:hypothetical protein
MTISDHMYLSTDETTVGEPLTVIRQSAGVPVLGSVPFPAGGVDGDGNLNVSGQAVFSGEVHADSDLTVGGKLHADGDVEFDGALRFDLHEMPVFANNDDALAGQLIPGDLYRTGEDPDHLCIVH